MGWWRLILIALILCALPTSSGYIGSPASGRASAAANHVMGYGMLGNDFSAIQAAGFNWTKIYASWQDLEPSRGTYSGSWLNSLSGSVDNARSRGLTVLINVGHTPAWARDNASNTAPPRDNADLANFMAYLATYLSGRVGAYEIWNEPNLGIEWGNQRPDPVRYAAMLIALYPRVKAADPNALVVTGGLATTGDWISDGAYGDLAYIRDLYLSGNVKSCSDGQGGLRSCFDLLGSHPFGGPYSPETGPDVAQYAVGMYFRRAEQHKQMMDVHGGDTDRGVFATEFGWLIDPGAFGVSCSWGSGWNSYKLTGTWQQQEATQADYFVRAFNYAYTNWPWMKGMIVFNLDFQDRPVCDQVVWYALTRTDNTRRPGYTSLSNMAKPGLTGPTLQISGTTAQFLLPTGTMPLTATQTIQITNAGSGIVTWTASKTPQTWLALGTPSTGTAPSNLAINVDKTGLPTGTYTGTVTITAGGGALGSPRQIPVQLRVWHTVQVPTVGKH